jgi:hypothetical protein
MATTPLSQGASRIPGAHRLLPSVHAELKHHRRAVDGVAEAEAF